MILQIIIALVAIMAWVGLTALVMVWVERKGAGYIQLRPGPFEVGPQGALQPLVDGIKLMCKQLFIPETSDKLLFVFAPILSFLPVFLLFSVLPYGPILVSQDTNLAILLILAFAGFNVLAVMLAGWAQNNKWGLLGAARAVAQNVAYEIPLLLSVLAITFMTGSLSLVEITNGQGGWPWQWNVIYQPIAFIIFIIAAVGETNRAPFDLAEAESELTAGFHTEYSSMGFGLFFMAEYAYMMVVASVATVLFLGGYKGPFGTDGWWWFVPKAYAIMFFIVWIRWTYPRVTFAHLLNVNWKWLLPLATLNLLGTAFFMKLFA
ncbi:MAG: NADH-quinone oxidoreductase subunit NuoH [Desulfovibrionaceae bacterium]